MKSVAALLIAATLLGCAHPEPGTNPRTSAASLAIEEKMSGPAEHAVSTTQMIEQELEPDRSAMIEAVFRFELEREKQYRPANYYWFLSLDGGVDPDPVLFQHLNDMHLKLFPVSESKYDRENGISHKTRGGHGLVFRVSSIALLDTDTADVNGGYYEASMSADGETLRLERKDGRWTVVKWRMNWIS